MVRKVIFFQVECLSFQFELSVPIKELNGVIGKIPCQNNHFNNPMEDVLNAVDLKINILFCFILFWN